MAAVTKFEERIQIRVVFEVNEIRNKNKKLQQINNAAQRRLKNCTRRF